MLADTGENENKQHSRYRYQGKALTLGRRGVGSSRWAQGSRITCELLGLHEAIVVVIVVIVVVDSAGAIVVIVVVVGSTGAIVICRKHTSMCQQ